MPEQKYELKPVGVRYLCDCGNEMTFTGVMLPIYPPRYVHACDQCGKKENLGEKYPVIRWESEKL